MNLTAFYVLSNSPYLPTAEESELKLMLWPVTANCLQSPTLRALIWPINMVRSRSAGGLVASLCVDWHDTNNRECESGISGNTNL